MKKLVKGIAEFRRRYLPEYRERFARLASGQSPDALFITCSDSRIAANWFASTDPGDLFVVRNVGNLIPSCGSDGHSTADESEAAAIEFALLSLNVTDAIVCGHADCGAMHALLKGRDRIAAPHVRAWLRHGEPALNRPPQGAEGSSPVNRLSQANVLQQIDHLRTYPLVRERLSAGTLKLHGWWFEPGTGNVYAYEEAEGNFVLIDEAQAARILARLP